MRWRHLHHNGVAWITANPIHYIQLYDRPAAPDQVIPRTAYSTWWHWSSWSDRQIPADLFAELSGYAEEAFDEGHVHRCYKSVFDAYQALSLAAVNLTRKRAELSPLRPSSRPA